MYSTCIFCNSSLGRNEVIEHFPIGRRLAFDSATGRLWAICRKCERWNLSPIEERWEAIEECERAFGATAMRASTDNIGLARVGDGLELVRIGRPQRPEMAAWRYGDQFGRRRRRYYTYAGLGAVAVGGIYVVGPALGLYAFGGGAMFSQLPQLIGQVHRRAFGRVKLAVPGLNKPVVLEREHLAKTSLTADDSGTGWALRVAVPKKKFVLSGAPAVPGEPPRPRVVDAGRVRLAVFTGDEAIRVAGKLLPKVNAAGARKAEVQRAVSVIAENVDPARFFASEAQRAGGRSDRGRVIKDLPVHMRLALEMSAHEDAERRALEGELAMLEAAWKDADEIAGIADNLLLPDEMDGWLARLKLKR